MGRLQGLYPKGSGTHSKERARASERESKGESENERGRHQLERERERERESERERERDRERGGQHHPTEKTLLLARRPPTPHNRDARCLPPAPLPRVPRLELAASAFCAHK